MTHPTEIRRHANGSIDTDFYIRHCHEQRSKTAHDALGTVAGSARPLMKRWSDAARALASLVA